MMNCKKLSLALVMLSSAVIHNVYANEVKITVNKPMQVIYRLAYQDSKDHTVLGDLQTIQISDSSIIPIDLAHHTVAGVVIDSVAGHALPSYANQFNQPEQCTVATNLVHPTGQLKLIAEEKQIRCQVQGDMDSSALS